MDQEPGFEQLMRSGVAAHSRGDYHDALIFRQQAFELGEWPQPWDRGRAARDVAASYDRLGDLERASVYAATATKEHRELKDQGVERGAREFTVSAMYTAIIAARQSRPKDALRYIGEAWTTSQDLLGKKGKPHQYDVNLVGRVAGIEATFAKPTKRTRQIGRTAVQWARLSETNQVLGRNTHLNEAEVKAAQRKASIRGWAARSIVALQSLPTRRLTRPVSKLILNKIVL